MDGRRSLADCKAEENVGELAAVAGFVRDGK